MHADGVVVHPLVQSTGEAEFNEVELDDVFVPADRPRRRRGRGVDGRRLDAGPRARASTRASSSSTPSSSRSCSAWPRPTGASTTGACASQLAQAATEVRLFQLHNWRSLTRLSKGEAPGPEGSALKLYWSEMSKRLHQTALDVLGDGVPAVGGCAEGNPADGAWQRSWLYYQASSIFAGTNEIQRTLVGERVLGLPRG